MKSESLRRVKTDLKDAHRIALSVQDHHFRLTVPWAKNYRRLHELSRFYNQLNADWTYCILQEKSAENCNDFLHSLATHFYIYLVI